MANDWLPGSQDALPMVGSIRHSLPLSSDGQPPCGLIGDSLRVDNAWKPEEGITDTDRNHSNDALNVRVVNPIGSPAPATLLSSKPSTRKRKVRPKDKLDSLQKQLDDIVAQVQQLTLVNEQLHCKNDVLTSLLECSDEVELMAVSASRQLAACIRDPAGPHPPVVRAMHSLTPQSWLALYSGKVAEVGRWLASCGDLDQAASNEAVQKLAAAWQEDTCMHIQYAITLRREVFFAARRIVYAHFAHKDREEEFWGDVVRSLELTPAQEQRIVLACDIYQRCNSRLHDDLQGPGGAVECEAPGCGPPPQKGSLLEQVTSNMMRCKHLIKGVGHWLYGRAFTPLQTAKCFLHSHPILPNPILMMTAVAHEVRSRRPLPPTAAAVEPFATHSKAAGWAAAHGRAGNATQVR